MNATFQEQLERDGFIVVWTYKGMPRPGDVRIVDSPGDPIFGAKLVAMGPSTHAEWASKVAERGEEGEVEPYAEFYRAVAE